MAGRTASPDEATSFQAVVESYKGACGENAALPEGLQTLDGYLAWIDAGADYDALLNPQPPKEGDGRLPEPETSEPVVEVTWSPFDGDPDRGTFEVLTLPELNLAE